MAQERSPNYPSIPLPEAIDAVRTLWNKEKRTSVNTEVASIALGYKGVSGPSRTKLAALKKYGLVEYDSNGVRVSELAMKILHSPDGSDEQAKAIMDATIKPDIFQELAASHAEASDDALKSHLIINKKFTEEGARQLIKSFRGTLEFAKLKAPGYTEASTTQENEAMTVQASTTTGTETRSPAAGKPGVKVLSFILGDDVTAEVRLVGEKIKPSHLEGLGDYIALTKKLMERNKESTED